MIEMQEAVRADKSKLNTAHNFLLFDTDRMSYFYESKKKVFYT